MKRVITILFLVVFCTVSSAEENEKENNLSLELTSNMRSPRVGQNTTIQLKIAGQAIAEIIKDTNNTKSTIFNKKPEFVYQFVFQSPKEGDCILGPYSLSFNGANLVSNALTLKILPEWDGGFGTFFRVDCNEINLGESFELVMETGSNEYKKINISTIRDRELASIDLGPFMSSTSIKDGKKTRYETRLWIITPKSRGEFLITKEFFREFPDDIEPPELKVRVK